MYASRCYQLFLSLSTTEKKTLAGLIQAYAVRKDTFSLYTYFLENYTNSLKKLEISRISQALKLSEAALRNILSDLAHCIEKLLVQNVLDTNKAMHLYYLTEELQNKGLEKYSLQALEELRKESNMDKYTDWIWKYATEKLTQELVYQKKRTTNSNYQACIDTLDSFYSMEKIKLAIYTNSHQALFNVPYKHTLLEEAIAILQAGSPIPLVALYLAAYSFQKNPSIEHYDALEHTIHVHASSIPFEELQKLYLILINLGITEMNKGEEAYIIKLFTGYQYGVNKGYLYIENKYISRFTYTNVIVMGLRLKEYENTYRIIEDWKSLLETQYAEMIYTYNLARYYYEVQEYKKALKLLANRQYDDTHTELAAKGILVKIYYEIQDWDSLEYTLQNLKMYLSRKDVTDYYKNIYTNFVLFTSKLLDCNARNVQEVLLKIQETPLIIHKDWLLLQIQKIQS